MQHIGENIRDKMAFLFNSMVSNNNEIYSFLGIFGYWEWVGLTQTINDSLKNEIVFSKRTMIWKRLI